ncbi:MAG: hypothetical protein INR70_25930 [Parafilimonas terrae]|nr:hypothetical protein [Parafilimonas terrae]
MTRLVCETCGEEIFSADGPCGNCDEPRPITDWKAFSQYGFRFEFAMKAMRLGMKLRRKAVPREVFTIAAGDILCNGEPLCPYRGSALHQREIMAEDWEVVQ